MVRPHAVRAGQTTETFCDILIYSFQGLDLNSTRSEAWKDSLEGPGASTRHCRLLGGYAE